MLPSILRSSAHILQRHGSVFKACHSIFLLTRPTNIHFGKNYCSEDSSLTVTQRFSKKDSRLVQKKGGDDLHMEFENRYTPEQRDYMLTSKRRSTYRNLLLQKIENSESPDDVLEIYQRHSDIMNPFDMIRILDVLGNFVAKRYIGYKELHSNKEFQALCQGILKMSRRMDAQDLLSILHKLFFLKVDPEYKLIKTILQLMKHTISDLKLKDLVHLAYLLNRLPATPLSEALLIAVPLLLENSLYKEPLESLSVIHLGQALTLGVKGSIRNVNVILHEIYEREAIDSKKIASYILWPLLDVYERQYFTHLNSDDALICDTLLKECFKAYSIHIDSFPFEQVRATLAKVCRAHYKYSACYSESLLEAIAVYCINRDVGVERASIITRTLLQMNFLSEDLTKYAVSSFLKNHEAFNDRLAVRGLITAISTCSLTNPDYKRAAELLLDYWLKGADLLEDSRRMLYFVLDILNIGIHPDHLLEMCMSPEYLKLLVDNRSSNDVTGQQLLHINQILSLVFKSSYRVPDEILVDVNITTNDESNTSELGIRLREIYEDPDCVVSGILTDDNLLIDHLIVMDEKNIPQMISSLLIDRSIEEFSRLSDLLIPETYRRVAVLDIPHHQTYRPRQLLKRKFQVHQKILQASGFIVVPVIQSLVDRQRGYEKNLYIKDLIDDCL